MSNFQPEQAPSGADLLDQAHKLLTTYCALPCAEAADAVVLWAAATHALPALPFAPRLSVRSATKRSGKSRVLDVVAPMSHAPLKTVNATVAAIFRSLGKDHPPTLIFDEIDSVFGSAKVAENNEDLRGLLNAGFERGNPSIRCVGPMQTPTEFPSFAMAALAGIGSLPDTIEDRSIIIGMKRRKATETVKPFRVRRDRPALDRLGEQLGEWLTDPGVVLQLEEAEPATDLEDRAADVWEGLLMVADLAGGQWPDRARAAAKVLTTASAGDEEEDTLGVRLLHDLREVFDLVVSEFVPTDILLQHLTQLDDAPWKDMDLTGHRLGKLLGEFGIRSKRDKTGKKRGYYRSHFADAWDRYPSKGDDGDGPEHADQASEASESVNTSSDQQKPSDISFDTSDATDKASEQASNYSSRSDPNLTDADASDAYPVGICDKCGQPAEVRQNRATGNHCCRDCASHLWRAAS